MTTNTSTPHPTPNGTGSGGGGGAIERILKGLQDRYLYVHADRFEKEHKAQRDEALAAIRQEVERIAREAWGMGLAGHRFDSNQYKEFMAAALRGLEGEEL